MNIEKAMEFIHGTSWMGSRLGLERIQELMWLLGNPEKKMKFVHIAGTNGKGSTAAMLASVLKHAGYKVGLYTSPYIEKFGELMQINGAPISDGEIISLASEFQKITPKMTNPPTEYELITAMALLYFYQQECGIVVLEVGMGGRLDSTNVIETPEVAAIMNIGLDHMAQLGNSVEKIASEKAGIIKKNGIAVCHPQIPSVEKVLREKCQKTSTQVEFVKNEAIIPLSLNLDGQIFNYSEYENLQIPLLGEHQLRNAAVVIEIIEKLRAKDWNINESALKNGLLNTNWKGRFEVLCKNPAFIADVAHNTQGIRATLGTLKKIGAEKSIFIFGVLADKNFNEMAELLVPQAKKFILVTPENPRALPAHELELCIKKSAALNNIVEKNFTAVCESIPNGVETAFKAAEPNDTICALGSFSMIGVFTQFFLSNPKVSH